MGIDDNLPAEVVVGIAAQASGLMAHVHETACIIKHGRTQNDDEVLVNCKTAGRLVREAGVAVPIHGIPNMTVRQSKQFLLLVAREIIKVLE